MSFRDLNRATFKRNEKEPISGKVMVYDCATCGAHAMQAASQWRQTERKGGKHLCQKYSPNGFAGTLKTKGEPCQ